MGGRLRAVGVGDGEERRPGARLAGAVRGSSVTVIEVETRTVDGADGRATALGAAAGATLAVDLPTDAGGSGRGFGEEELLCLAVAADLSNGLFRTSRAQHLELTRVVVRVRGVFPGAAPATGGTPVGGAPALVDGAGDDAPDEHVEYDVDVAGNARPVTLRGLVDACDRRGAVLGLLRRAVPVRRGPVTVRSAFPVRTLEEVLAVCRFMERWAGPWWVGGGWAIDLWAGGARREHEDVELAVPGRDQAALRALVADWRPSTPEQGRCAPLDGEEVLEAPRAMWQLRRAPGTRVPVAGMPRAGSSSCPRSRTATGSSRGTRASGCRWSGWSSARPWDRPWRPPRSSSCTRPSTARPARRTTTTSCGSRSGCATSNAPGCGRTWRGSSPRTAGSPS
jgi:hypothetical protein